MSMSTPYAPIALFVYARPDHTARTLTALAANELAAESELFIFSDAARSEKDQIRVDQVRQLAHACQGFKAVHVVERPNNFGLAKSITEGVTALTKAHGRVIVLEDDLVTGPAFLHYMNAGLDRYATDERVMQIGGYNHSSEHEGEADTCFLPLTTSWGWATWERAWAHWPHQNGMFEKLERSRALRKQFDLNGAYPYFQMLLDQRAGKNNSWAIRWYLVVFSRSGLSLFPRRSLVSNIGFDGSGEHCGDTTPGSSTTLNFYPQTFPTNVGVASTDLSMLVNHLKSLQASPLRRAFNAAKQLVPLRARQTVRSLARRLVYQSMVGKLAMRGTRRARGLIYRIRLQEGTVVSSQAQLLGMQHIRLGRNTIVGDRCWLNVNDRQTGLIGIDIGNNCFIGRDNFLSSGKRITIGDYALTAKDCQFIGSTHIYSDPTMPYLATGTSGSDEIRVGANCFFGVGVTVLGHVTIGHGCIIGAGATVTCDIPPFSLVVGSPARVIKRFDFASHQWVRVDQFQTEHLIPAEPEYLQSLRARHPKLDMPTIAALRSEGEL
jgi:acetyltransferase-like isoleucine patch superfamily enzyme